VGAAGHCEVLPGLGHGDGFVGPEPDDAK
jgi:hypothetical protein